MKDKTKCSVCGSNELNMIGFCLECGSVTEQEDEAKPIK